MDQQQLWQRFCTYLQIHPEVGFTVDVSRMHFDEQALKPLITRMNTAFSDMNKLEAGEIVNPDEQRMVGHYWLRAPELSPSEQIKSEINASIADITQFASAMHQGTIRPEKSERFKNVLLIGIGGSALGPQLVSDALWTERDPMKIYFVDNTDPDGISRTIAQLGDELGATLTIVTSKSGGTVETRNGAIEAAKAYERLGLNFAKHFVAVTCPGSKLSQQASKEGWLKQFAMWDWVGGRTSLFSAVGLLPAALQGVAIDELLRGAREMDVITRVEDPLKNPAALMAMMWYLAGDGKGKKDLVVLPYKDRLCLFSKYLQQLVMESLGKERDLKGNVVHQGLAVYGNKGSTDQHAYVQQLRDGVHNFFVTFIEVLGDYTAAASYKPSLEVEPGLTSGDYLSGFYQGTRRALFENGRQSITITIDQLDGRSLGALIALYDRTVGFYASLVEINAYHQPGVEAGKKAAAHVTELQKQLLEQLQKEGQPRTAAELASAVGAPAESETVYKILEHLAANPGRKVTRDGTERHPERARYVAR